MLKVVEKIENPVTVKMPLYKLKSLSYDMEGTLRVEKEILRTIIFYWSRPDNYTEKKVILCTWAYGKATLPQKWLDKQAEG